MHVTIIYIMSAYKIYRICRNEGKEILGGGQMHIGMLGLANFEDIHWTEGHAVTLG